MSCTWHTTEQPNDRIRERDVLMAVGPTTVLYGSRSRRVAQEDATVSDRITYKEDVTLRRAAIEGGGREIDGPDAISVIIGYATLGQGASCLVLIPAGTCYDK